VAFKPLPKHRHRALKRVSLAFGDQRVGIRFPHSLEHDFGVLLSGVRRAKNKKDAQIITVAEGSEERFSLSGVGTPVEGLGRADVLNYVAEHFVKALISDMSLAPVLHAGAVSRKGCAIMVAGASGAGKSSLIAWLLDRGYSYITDEICAVPGKKGAVIGLPRAVVVKSDARQAVERLAMFKGAPRILIGTNIAIAPTDIAAMTDRSIPCGLIILPQFMAGSRLEITPLTAGECAFRLMACNLNARNLPDGGLGAIAALSSAAPCVTLRYGDYAQLDGVLDVLADLVIEKGLDASAGQKLLGAFTTPLISGSTGKPQTSHLRQPATPRGSAKKLTIGMATYDDYDGVYFSLQALRLYHPEIATAVEFLVIDNHPGGPCAAPLKQLETKIPNYRYVPHDVEIGTAAPRNKIFEEASGEFVLCMDSHVMFESGALKRLLAFFEENPATPDLLQGPLVYDDLGSCATHFHPAWRAGMFGYWEKDKRGAEPEAPPFEIGMQGLGVFACRRTAWPGFNPLFRGFGGEEGYIHEKFRRAGGRVLCLPFLRWIHRFGRPMGIPYRNKWEDRIRNYLIGYRELGLSSREAEEHFRRLLGTAADAIFRDVQAELADYPPSLTAPVRQAALS
jgi:hypothetical protein